MIKMLQVITAKVKNWECTYADGKKSHCWKYNIADIFDVTGN